MAEDRMLSDEILLGLIKKNGGPGGTTNYNDLSNKPSIAGTELQGNKSLADLGIASAQSVTNITNGASINNFAGVETALAEKQNALTAGDYIQFDGNEISVNRNIEVENVDYNIKYVNNNTASITKSKDGQVISTQSYNWGIYETSIDGLFYFGGASSSIGFVWRITLIKDSTTHSAGYSVDFKTNDTTMDITESFPEQDISGYKLVIKSEMDTALAGKQNTLTFDDTPTDGSNNPVKSNGIYDALATKANTDMVAADFNAGTYYTAGNYCVQDGKLYKFKNNHSGAWSSADVDEVKITGELSALKSGLINLHGYTDISESILDPSLSFTATENCILWLHTSYSENITPYFNYLVNNTLYGIKGSSGSTLDNYVFLRAGDVFRFNDDFPCELALTNFVYLV